MAQQAAPLYGRFPFLTIDEFITRLKLISQYYLPGMEFNSYLTTYQSQSFYGLDYDELRTTFLAHAETIKSITTSAAHPSGSSVNLSLRFSKDSQQGEGQFIVVTQSKFDSKAIREILLGDWHAPSEEDQQRDEALSNLISTIKEFKEREDLEEKEFLMALEEEERQEKEIPSTPTPPKPAPLSRIQDSFHFNDEVDTQRVLDLLNRLSDQYFKGQAFHIRMITTDGEPYSNIGMTGLRRVLDKRRNLILKASAELNLSNGESMLLSLSFGPMARNQNAELEAVSRYSREIRAKVREALEDQIDYLSPSASMLHGMFLFDEYRFSIDKTIAVIQRISDYYLDRETPTAFLSTTEGKTYPALNLRQLKKTYLQYQSRISFLLFGVNQSLTGQTFSLMFQFGTPDQELYGSLSIMWGDGVVHQEVKDLLWRELGLSKYVPRHQASSEVISERILGPEQGVRNSVFNRNTFKTQPRTSLVTMPLEAYWSDALWMHLQQTLRSIGWDSYRAGALYAQEILDDTWQAINEVEVVIADLTYKHPDVFYKLGLAHALGKRIILITQHARDLPPDFHRFPYVVYDNNIHGLQRLSERIIELLKLK